MTNMNTICFCLGVFLALFGTTSALSPTNCTQYGEDECGIGGKCIGSSAALSVCVCYQGYFRSAYYSNCQDINECMYTGADLCPNGFCINMDGSYYCGCMAGFAPSFPDGRSCRRIRIAPRRMQSSGGGGMGGGMSPWLWAMMFGGEMKKK